MKQLFRCEYCNKIGTKEEIHKHEKTCNFNKDRKSCYTCANAKFCLIGFKCALGVEIPMEHHIENCDKYEWNKTENTDISNSSSLLGGLL